jgi:hypothetical protein
MAVANSGSDDVSILLNDGKWAGPSPPPGGGGHLPGAVPRPQPVLASPIVSAEALLWVDASAPANAPPSVAALPGDNVNRPLLGADTAKAWTPAVSAAVCAPRQLAPVLARARTEGVALGLIDRLFAAWEGGWLGDRSAEEAWWSGR